MTTTTTFGTPPASTTAARVWRTGAGAGLGAAVATTACAAVAHAGGVSLAISGKVIPALGFGQLTIIAALVGTILAATMARRADRARRTFLETTIALTLLSLVPDAIVHAGAATKLTLALTHLVAAAIVIPALAGRLDD